MTAPCGSLTDDWSSFYLVRLDLGQVFITVDPFWQLAQIHRGTTKHSLLGLLRIRWWGKIWIKNKYKFNSEFLGSSVVFLTYSRPLLHFSLLSSLPTGSRKRRIQNCELGKHLPRDSWAHSKAGVFLYSWFSFSFFSLAESKKYSILSEDEKRDLLYSSDGQVQRKNKLQRSLSNWI